LSHIYTKNDYVTRTGSGQTWRKLNKNDAFFAGPNHDNTTNFGDPLLFEYNATGTQRLVFQPSYWVLGHLSRFARPGATIVNITAGPGVAATNADYEAVRCGKRTFCAILVLNG
jgi:hypothetical protein